MLYLAFVLVSVFLFAGFLWLTRFEAARGAKLFADKRATLDAEAERIETAILHIDLSHFLRMGVRALIARVAHDIAHATLLIVRFVERTLTRAVRSLRERRTLPSVTTDGSPSSDFVAAMKDFKEELRSGRKTEESAGDIIENREG
jgi:hypothetical protein